MAAMLDRVRAGIHRVITTRAGDRFLPVRLPKDLARRVNSVLGEPIASKDELARRRAARARLAELRTSSAPAKTEPATREQAPVMIYFEKERNARLLGRIRETLDTKNLEYTLLDVTGDETTKDFVMREAHVKEDELPIVFVAGTPIGGYNELTDWDVSGKLDEIIYGR